MADSFYFRGFRPLDLTDMYLAFLDSFSDYPVEFSLTKEQFVRKFVQKLKLDFSLSIGAYDLDALAAFVFTSINFYEDKKTAYNGGTGVRLAYRGQKLIHRIYDHLLPLLHQQKVKQCVLEVLVENDRAIRVYEAIGFTQTKYFKCFILTKPPVKKKAAITLNLFEVQTPNWLVYDTFSDAKPSFLDSRQMVTQNLANEVLIEAYHNQRCIGYGIYQPAIGRISQLAVHPDFREQGVGSHIVRYMYDHSYKKVLTIININRESVEIVAFLERIGFKNQLDQYEMTLTLE